MALYLITGGAGFIGSHLVDHLHALGHQTRVLDNFSTGSRAYLPLETEVLTGDIRDENLVTRALTRVAGCFHLAAAASVQKSIAATLETTATNGLGTVIVMKRASAAMVPVVYASSAAVYGDNQMLPLSEREYPHPLSPYAADKVSNEMYAKALGVTAGLRSFGLRFFNVYGTRQDPKSPYSGVVSIFLDRARAGRDLVVFGDGSQERDFIHISDVARMIAAAMEHVSIQAPVANVCTGRGTKILDLAHLIIDLHGKAGVAVSNTTARTGDIYRSVGNPAQAQVILGLRAETNLRAGLATL